MNPLQKYLLVVASLLATGFSTEPDPPLAVHPVDPGVVWSPCPPIFPQGCELTVLHGNPGQPGADVFLRVPPGYVLPSHSHTSAEHMMLATGRLTVKYSGAPETTLTSGAYAYGPAGLPHRGACVGDEACVLFIAFDGPVDANAYTGSLD